MKSYDLAIIGTGPGGYVAALYASRHNLKVCVIEKDLVGGTCLNRGCIPTKSLLNSASILSTIREAPAHGIIVDNPRVDFPAMAARKDAVTLHLRTGIETLFRANKIDIIRGSAVLGGGGVVKVDGTELFGAESIIIASGSRCVSLPGIKIDEKNILSSDGALEIKQLPASMTIIGGGVIGCEFANLFNALGVKVTIVELTERLIPTQSREVSKRLEVIFKKRGIEIFTSGKVESIDSGAKIEIKIAGKGAIQAEKALISVGRRPNTDALGLDEAGIRKDGDRIVVDEYLTTSVVDIYAIGDCVRGPLLAHKASYDAIVAVDNIIGNRRKVDYSMIPNCIWTDPEIASVGLSEEEARAKHPDVRVAKFPYLASGKAYVMGKSEGFIKIIGQPGGKVLGVEIFGQGACDLIGEAVLAKTLGINIKDWARVVHGHPTLSEIFQEACHIFCGTPIHSI